MRKRNVQSGQAPLRRLGTALCTTSSGRLARARLRRGARALGGAGASSHEVRGRQLVPAFLDAETGITYVSRYADGRRAPVHTLDGLPESLVLVRGPSGRVISVKGSVVAGFCRAGRFYTRTEAARLAADRRTAEDDGAERDAPSPA